MKISEILERLDKSKPDINGVQYNLYEELDLYLTCSHIDTDKSTDVFKSYDVQVWHCTDETVGLFAHYLNDEFMFTTYKDARKSDTLYSWKSEEAYNKVCEYMKSICATEDQEPDIDIINMDSDIETMDVYLYSMYKGNCYLYKGDRVEVTEAKRDGYNSDGIVTIAHNGKKKKVNTKELELYFNIK